MQMFCIISSKAELSFWVCFYKKDRLGKSKYFLREKKLVLSDVWKLAMFVSLAQVQIDLCFISGYRICTLFFFF